MRKIKFRAWQKHHKRMLEVVGLRYQNNEITQIGVKYPSGHIPRFVYYSKDNPTFYLYNNTGECILELMQYTGLKDKNGEEIYEGDVINISSHTPFYNVVEFDKEGASFMLRPVDKRWSNSYFANYKNVDKERFEIIGNIYENKELIEVECN